MQKKDKKIRRGRVCGVELKEDSEVGKVLPRWRLGAADLRIAAGEYEEARVDGARRAKMVVVAVARRPWRRKRWNLRVHKRCFVIVTRRAAAAPWIY